MQMARESEVYPPLPILQKGEEMKKWNKPLHIMKRIISALMAVVFVIISTSSNSEAAAFGLPSVSLHKVYYNGTRIKHIAYNGTTVWSYGGTIAYHAVTGDSTVSITDYSQVEPTYTPNAPGTDSGNYKFMGWHKGSKATTVELSGAEAVSASPNANGYNAEYYAVYTHKHTGNKTDGGGCYTKEKKGARKTKECGAAIVEHHTEEDPNHPGDANYWTERWTCAEGHTGNGDYYEFINGTGKCKATVYVEPAEYEASTWECDCGKTEGVTLETW